MNIQKISDLKFASFIAQSQVKMAKETEDYDLDYDTVFKGVSAVINDPLKGEYYISFEGANPIACLLTVTEWSDWRNSTVLWIHSVYVNPDNRQSGVFKSMYNYLKLHVESSPDLAGLRLYVDKTNTAAISVYEKLGMQSEHYALCEWLK